MFFQSGILAVITLGVGSGAGPLYRPPLDRLGPVSCERGPIVAGYRATREGTGGEARSGKTWLEDGITRPDVRRAVEDIVGPGRAGFERWLVRLDTYRDRLVPLLAQHDVPDHAFYVAVVESNLDPHARSRSGALGLWQMMPATARAYGLRVGRGGDQRTDPEAATLAAAAYLRVLHNRFDDWLLAWAGYNAGGGHVARAMKATGASDFWSLAEAKGALSAQTRAYVPKILAVAHVERNRRHYGFSSPRGRAKDRSYGSTSAGSFGGEATFPLVGATKRIHVVARGETLWSLARRYGVPLDSLRSMNGIEESRIAVGTRLRLR